MKQFLISSTRWLFAVLKWWKIVEKRKQKQNTKLINHLALNIFIYMCLFPILKSIRIVNAPEGIHEVIQYDKVKLDRIDLNNVMSKFLLLQKNTIKFCVTLVWARTSQSHSHSHSHIHGMTIHMIMCAVFIESGFIEDETFLLSGSFRFDRCSSSCFLCMIFFPFFSSSQMLTTITSWY